MHLVHLLFTLLSSSTISASPATSNQAESPPSDILVTPKVLHQNRHPLPTEKDGVSPDNTTVNAAASNVTQSCWTNPSGAPIFGWYSNYSSGQCQVCITVNGTGTIYYNPFFEIWVRDASNQAIGGIDPQLLVPFKDPRTQVNHSEDEQTVVSNDISFATAGKQLYMATFLDRVNPEFSTVQLAWGFRPPENFWDSKVIPNPAIMLFHLYRDPKKRIHQPLQNCILTGNDDDGAISYYQCWFNCV